MSYRAILLVALLACWPLTASARDRRHTHRHDDVIRETYQTFLQRQPNSSEMATWRRWSRDKSAFDVQAQILADEEHFARYDKNINRFTRGLFSHYLDRRPTQEERDYWRDYFFNECNQSRTAFTRGFLEWVQKEQR